ncbi:ParB/RepB/Spo0J family partition protein (plasmid) [Streptomyces sp. NBC_00440]|uniref:ParB/RepB/Spo0J family partition protein n=1 Tax=Streptomyces sp. NBC_00440 TaxID=2975741 RepID=UPI002E1BB025
MSKAASLGSGSSFQRTRPISSRRAAVNAATNAPTEGTPPPVELEVGLISLNPLNPRTSLGDLTDLAGSIRDHGQKTAISIMGRFAYLKANPDQAEDALEEGTKYVVIDGNSRLAAAREAGNKTVKVMLDDELGSNPDEILESALVANIHRNDLDHLDEANALQQLLKVHGTQEALAARLHRSQGWVSQRLALLGLNDDLKAKLQSGEEPADLLRRVGNKKADEQEEHLRRLKAKKAEEDSEKEARRAARRKQPQDEPVGTEADKRGNALADGRPRGEKQPDAEEVAPRKETIPDPRTTTKPSASIAPPAKPQIKMPWGDEEAVGEIMLAKLSESQFSAQIRWGAARLSEHQRELLIQELIQQRENNAASMQAAKV